MEVLEYIKKAEGGKIVIDVPIELEGKELLVLVREKKEHTDDNKFNRMSSEERLNYVMQFCGTARYPDYPIDKYDVYDQ